MDLNSNMHSIKWRNHKEDIIDEQQYLFENNIACDCVLISAEGKLIQAHQIVLSSSSDFFRKMLTEVPAAIEPTIHIPDADAYVLDAMLKFIYTGQTHIASTHLSALLELCNVLDIKGIVTNGCSLNRMDNKSDQNINKNIEQRKKQPSITSDENEEYFLVMQGDHIETDDLQMDGEQDYDIEYLDDETSLEVKDEPLDETHPDASDCIAFEIEKSNEGDSLDESSPSASSTIKRKRIIPRQPNTRSQIDEALNEVNKGKTIHRLSVEYNLPRSTLYHHFRNNEYLRQNYRSERKTALDKAVQSVLHERLSLKRASDKFQVPKTAIWREVRKYEQYQPSNKEVTEERQNAQQEILSGKSLASISAKYGIPMTTLHRDKKKLSVEGKLPESFRVKDRTENSEYNQRLEMALQKCRQGMSQYQAARLFKIPKATMWRYAHALLKADQMAETKNEQPDDAH